MEGVRSIARFAAADPAPANAALRSDGVVVLDGLLTSDTVDALREAVMRRHPEFADKALLTDFQNNGEGRFIAPVAISRAVYDSGVLHLPALMALAEGALGPDWVVDGFGMLMAFPGCTEQHHHRDGTELFPGTQLAKILPPFALTVLIPLVDVDSDNGATGFHLGTHRYPPPDSLPEPAMAPLPRGSLIAWNYETLHWGLPNRSDRPRPALYLTLCRPFWTDMTNFGGTARTRLMVDEDVVPLLDRRFARASGGGRWVHAGLGKVLRKVGEQPAG
ncbi:hypothetical protein GCM10011515_15940 [Tsuneonella deserti]|uniref:Phytanoyl-CoA dioxygenase (PhyH) n=1 Tax=Tsuneonella deserti TaxID=2035528 RepID=A0ABQ1S9X0_9SPHN|nr:phytanoyl-CoA dioxygenase family protein [Tsuneonella deserti]GGD96971.1 hypothetical protein GCM10011515_15940 [Tsuneonella deserti]